MKVLDYLNIANWLTFSLPFGSKFTSFLPFLIPLFLTACIIYLISKICRYVLRTRIFIKEDLVLLELIPPSVTEQNVYTTDQLFSLIHALGKSQSIQEKLLGLKNRFSLELISTKEQGIRYLIRTTPRHAISLKKNLLSYLSQLEIKEVDEYIPDSSTVFDDKPVHIIEFKLAHHFAYPLKKQNVLEKHDPIAYITGMMTKLSPSELVSLQIIVSSTHSREARKVRNLALSSKDVMKHLEDKMFPQIPFLASLLDIGIKIISFATSTLLWSAAFFIHDGKNDISLAGIQSVEREHPTNILEQEVVSSIYEKVQQPLFETTIRLLVISDSQTNLRERLKGLVSSFSTFSASSYQSLLSNRSSGIQLIKKLQYFFFQYRLPSLAPNVLSVSEISGMYHFPNTSITKTEDIVKTLSKRLPAPLSLKNDAELDVTFAKNTFGGSTTQIGLTEEERRRHVYILGATGTGKTTLLLSMINQDIQKGKGVCLIDPHGDLAESLLPLIPKNRIKDVIYFNPDDCENPIALNLLELPDSPSATEAEKLRDQEFITESIISLFNKLYPDHTARPRMEYILRNTIYTAFLTPHPTIFTILKLLVDAPFRQSVVKKLSTLPDKNLYNFWKYEFNKAGDYQKVSMIMPITNKIGRFQFSPTARGILEQEKSKIDFENIMDSGKILICNVSKGRLGEDISEMFGILLLTKIQLAALRRAKKKISDRKDFYLYVDEFQNFATPAFAQILSEARKYRLNAILAHQTVSQIEDRSLVNITLANAGTVICFRTANPLDEELMLPQFAPHIDQGEISNLPSYHFFMKVSAIEPKMPFSGETLPIKIPVNPERVNQIVNSSRALYANHVKSESSTKEQSKGVQEQTAEVKPPTKAKRRLH